MDANGFCNYAHIDKFRRVHKERAKKNEEADAKVTEKRPSDGRGDGTREKRQRNGGWYGVRPAVREEGQERTRRGGGD